MAGRVEDVRVGIGKSIMMFFEALTGRFSGLLDGLAEIVWVLGLGFCLDIVSKCSEL